MGLRHPRQPECPLYLMALMPKTMRLGMGLPQHRPQGVGAAWMQGHRSRFEPTWGINFAYRVSLSQFLGWYMWRRSVERLLTCHGCRSGALLNGQTCEAPLDVGHQNACSHEHYALPVA